MATNPDTMIDSAAETETDVSPVPVAEAPVPEQGEAPAPSPGGDDWRTQWAGEDDGLRKFLGRFHSPDAAVRKWKEQHDDIRSGKYLKPLGDDATDDEVAAYRKQMGVPDAPDGYLESLPDGLVVGDDDKPFVDKFLAEMHGSNAPKGAVDSALKAYYSIVEEQSATQAERAAEVKNASIEELRSEWGLDYKRNLTAMHSHLATLPAAVQEMFKGATMADGTPVGFNAEVLKWATGLALESNPIATVVPGAGANQASAIAEEIATIEKTMRENRAGYNRDEKMQARYRELLGAKEKLA